MLKKYLLRSKAPRLKYSNKSRPAKPTRFAHLDILSIAASPEHDRIVKTTFFFSLSLSFPIAASAGLALPLAQLPPIPRLPLVRSQAAPPGNLGGPSSSFCFSVFLGIGSLPRPSMTRPPSMASPSAVAMAAHGLQSASHWWEEVNNSPAWQDWIFHALAALFGIVGTIALIQLIRIECRVPEYGWTTQKVFHFLNFIVNAVRCVVFVFRRGVQQLKPEILQHVLLDMPSLAFFTTYALLVLFWAEIYYQIALWFLQWWKPVRALVILSKVFFAGVSLFAALGFIVYGGRLFFMLQRFPVESKGRRKKLQEVGYVTTICFTCFLIRSVMMGFNAFDKAADLDVLNHPILNFLYYLLVEILPSSLVLFILRKLPPKRGITQYHPIH
ncbi:hypothetical protein Taro_010913 [Colocasia esculenta]|uniref:THH1/TOM1/TOM3 domain-containing protein n=1 Tax=Colocasia esculenta TaxID=4460 RepID=A0A843U938_COLES|nr:hypothetical protein [Colocasia esculenta]